ncbi:MAG: hypothetical protein IJN86_01705 [Clostridia bacterium]|nr:hypothetical protein [Clostridia bacterium]
MTVQLSEKTEYENKKTLPDTKKQLIFSGIGVTILEHSSIVHIALKISKTVLNA